MDISQNLFINKALTGNFINRRNKNENQTQRFHIYILSLRIIASAFVKSDDAYLRSVLTIKAGILLPEYFRPPRDRRKKNDIK